MKVDCQVLCWQNTMVLWQCIIDKIHEHCSTCTCNTFFFKVINKLWPMHMRNFREFIIHQKKKKFLSILSFALLKFICLSSSNYIVLLFIPFCSQCRINLPSVLGFLVASLLRCRATISRVSCYTLPSNWSVSNFIKCAMLAVQMLLA